MLENLSAVYVLSRSGFSITYNHPRMIYLFYRTNLPFLIALREFIFQVRQLLSINAGIPLDNTAIKPH